jgi:hypothetical protein
MDDKQRMIVRQNALGHATSIVCKWLEYDENVRKEDSPSLVTAIIAMAQQFETWVMREESKTKNVAGGLPQNEEKKKTIRKVNL